LRVTYAYADALAQAGRTADAIQWFTNANELDTEEVLDAEKRIAELNEGTSEKNTEDTGESNNQDSGAESSEDKLPCLSCSTATTPSCSTSTAPSLPGIS